MGNTLSNVQTSPILLYAETLKARQCQSSSGTHEALVTVEYHIHDDRIAKTIYGRKSVPNILRDAGRLNLWSFGTFARNTFTMRETAIQSTTILPTVTFYFSLVFHLESNGQVQKYLSTKKYRYLTESVQDALGASRFSEISFDVQENTSVELPNHLSLNQTEDKYPEIAPPAALHQGPPIARLCARVSEDQCLPPEGDTDERPGLFTWLLRRRLDILAKDDRC